MRTWLVTLILICLAIPAWSQTARPVNPAAPPPNQSASVVERIDWLVEHPTHVATHDILPETLAAIDSVTQMERIRREFLPLLPNGELKLDTALSLAGIYRTARRLETAAELFAQAFALSGDTNLETLLAHAQILFELGEFERAGSEARVVLTRTTDYVLKRRSYTLAARIAHESGQTGQAVEMLETLASLATSESDSAELVEVETLLLLRQILAASDDPVAAERADELLREVFPGSLAVEMLDNRNRSLTSPGLPSAMVLSEAGVPDEESGATGSSGTPAATTARRDQPRLTAVQVGSFSDSDNAEHLTADLQRLGLTARTEAVPREGTVFHQVIVTIPDGTTENAARVLSILRENGFDGFLVY